MTKKDYVAIARVIAQCEFRAHPEFASERDRTIEYANNNARSIIAVDLCDIFAADNPRFDRERFLRACGIGAS